MKPLAQNLRPKSFDMIYGQDHLVGKNGVLTMMLKKKHYLSFILYGNPGTGKTTIAKLFSTNSDLEPYFFNASTDNKEKLKDILNTTNYHDILLIIDEVHRMKKDIQDYLLPFVEDGKCTFIGITTVNPYQSVNNAIRSRCHIYKVNDLNDDDIRKAIITGIKFLDNSLSFTKDAINMIIRLSNYEIRSALNLVEACSIVADDGVPISVNLVRSVAGKAKLALDGKEDNYYDILSALQKSIRGSDVDASLHYLARLVILGDLEIIYRRLLVIAYEDCGLANPTMGQKVYTAVQTCKIIGMPEARIMLANVVIEMALSPKSNSGYTALDKAILDIENGKGGKIPKHAANREIRKDPTIYHYPHDYKNSLNDQRYIPNELKDVRYYIPKEESVYEKALSQRKTLIDEVKKIKKK